MPSHKGNSKADKNNYRLISVLPVLSKIFERHLHNSLYVFLRDNDLLYQLQSAFRKHYSMVTAVLLQRNILDHMLFNLDDNRINSLVLAYFQKAFDLVSQGILIEGLCIYGLDECKASWVLCAPSFKTTGSARSCGSGSAQA